ncbi:hypothetical protein [Erwinia mallotivora]|uniref:hypothetical protein n=1 Tax=Erwinia mallotivora TaxID=69222 RepID=UPI0021C13547|nr:hypothetical protein [Erwinia mallotivora]
MQSVMKSLLIISPLILSGCMKNNVVINHFQDRNSGDTAEVRIIGFTTYSYLWDGYDCNQPYTMPPKGYYPHVRQAFEERPVFIDKGFKKSTLRRNKYPLDQAEYYVRAGKLMTFWASNHLSDGRLCGKTITIRPEKDHLYEFRNSNDQNMCYFELYEINKSTGEAKAMAATKYKDLCPK